MSVQENDFYARSAGRVSSPHFLSHHPQTLPVRGGNPFSTYSVVPEILVNLPLLILLNYSLVVCPRKLVITFSWSESAGIRENCGRKKEYNHCWSTFIIGCSVIITRAPNVFTSSSPFIICSGFGLSSSQCEHDGFIWRAPLFLLFFLSHHHHLAGTIV